MKHHTMARSISRRTMKNAAMAAICSTALMGAVLVGPAGAQPAEPTATATAVCDDGVGGIDVTIVDDSETYTFDLFIDDELVFEDEPTGSTSITPLDDGVYSVAVDAFPPADEPSTILEVDVTVSCSATTTTTTAPPSSTTTTAAPAPSTTVAPRAAAQAGAALKFTG